MCVTINQVLEVLIPIVAAVSFLGIGYVFGRCNLLVKRNREHD